MPLVDTVSRATLTFAIRGAYDALMNAVSETRSRGAKRAWVTRRGRERKQKANNTERASKQELSEWCEANGWRVVFFEGRTGAPRTGIVDAIIVRIRPGESDGLDVRLVQLKAGSGGLTGREITRIKRAVNTASLDWLAALFDGQTLQFLPEMPSPNSR